MSCGRVSVLLYSTLQDANTASHQDELAVMYMQESEHCHGQKLRSIAVVIADAQHMLHAPQSMS